MDDIEKIDDLIKKRFKQVHSKLSEENLNLIHPKSIENFIFHLVDNPELNPKKNNKLQELGEIRMKKKLLEYLKAVENTDLNKESAADLYKRYIFKISDFMSEYYGFSNGGGTIIIEFFLILTVGIIIDTILFLINWINFPLFTPMLLTLNFVRRIIKNKQKKQYGLFY